MKLVPRVVEKPWGRADLPSNFGCKSGSRIGEVWFEHPDARDLPLLVKYIFTSEKLSVQVHPNDQQALERGLARGKNECWYILDSEPGATLGLGLKSNVSRDELRAAALDGSIEKMMVWRPVSAGELYYIPAGTVHSIGAGIVLLEVQQNADLTYRLYDYGRPRELHLHDGIAVATLEDYQTFNARPAGEPINTVLVNSEQFSLIRVGSNEHIPPSLKERRRWIMPLQGYATSDGECAGLGECLFLEEGAKLTIAASAIALIGIEGHVPG